MSQTVRKPPRLDHLINLINLINLRKSAQIAAKPQVVQLDKLDKLDKLDNHPAAAPPLPFSRHCATMRSSPEWAMTAACVRPLWTADVKHERSCAMTRDSVVECVINATTTRRKLIGGAAGAALATQISGALAGPAPAGRLSLASLGIPTLQELPEDAAPPEQQIWRQASDPTTPKVLDFYEAVYERPAVADLFSESLVRLNKNFEIIPSAATEWSGSADGKTWTFKLAPDRVWSDGNPVTARDWVATFQYAADPEHAFDFSWFWLPVITNFAAATEGTVALEEIGVRQGADEFELVFETIDPAPYLPSMLLYSLPLSAAALETHGPLYNTQPDTAVSSGPFILEEWVRDQAITYKRNDTYAGPLVVPIQKVIVKMAAPNINFTLYEDGQIDYMENPAPAELQLIQSDPELSEQLYQGVGDFRVDYLFFDVTKAPFDNLLVRQAFSHVIDRDAIKQSILGPLGNPSFGFLAPGFPSSNQEALEDIQAYDPEMGKQLLAEAGYPDGEGFPALELWLRAPTPAETAVGNACASMITEQLGIEIEVRPNDSQTFTAALNAKPTEILFGFVSYGMDYLDPSNMLGVWRGGGRHSWVNEEYDAGLQEATTFLGDPAERLEMFKGVERILVEDVPAVFVHYRTPVQLAKPYVSGDALQPDDNGITAIHWPGFTTMSTVPEGIYITNEAPTDRD